MRCAKILNFALFAATICVIQPQVSAQMSEELIAANTKEEKIQVMDAGDSSDDTKASKNLPGNAEIKEVPKMSEVAKQPIYWICKNRSDVRTIRVAASKGTCTSTYSKEGTEKIVGQSAAIRSCYQVFANIRRNLENADYKCRDISASRISSSN